MGSLTGRTALVTGGAGGIGLASARALAREGAQVCIADRQFEGLEQTAASIGSDASAAFIELEDADGIDKFVLDIDNRLGKIDILVNAAGFCRFESWDEVRVTSFDQIVAINCRSLLFLTQSVARVMTGHGDGGSIVNVSSIAGRRGDPTNVVYSMTKMAVISLTQSAAAAYAPNGIRVNAIAPGYVQTAMLDQVFAHHGERLKLSRAEQELAALERIPLGRMSTVEDQADVVAFLASDQSKYVTGQTLNVDGGIYAH